MCWLEIGNLNYEKTNTSLKTVVGIRKRFKYKGEDQKGKNQSFLRINVDRTTREVTRVNEKNWTKQVTKTATQRMK